MYCPTSPKKRKDHLEKLTTSHTMTSNPQAEAKESDKERKRTRLTNLATFIACSPRTGAWALEEYLSQAVDYVATGGSHDSIQAANSALLMVDIFFSRSYLGSAEISQEEVRGIWTQAMGRDHAIGDASKLDKQWNLGSNHLSLVLREIVNKDTSYSLTGAGAGTGKPSRLTNKMYPIAFLETTNDGPIKRLNHLVRAVGVDLQTLKDGPSACLRQEVAGDWTWKYQFDFLTLAKYNLKLQTAYYRREARATNAGGAQSGNQADGGGRGPRAGRGNRADQPQGSEDQEQTIPEGAKSADRAFFIEGIRHVSSAEFMGRYHNNTEHAGADRQAENMLAKIIDETEWTGQEIYDFMTRGEHSRTLYDKLIMALTGLVTRTRNMAVGDNVGGRQRLESVAYSAGDHRGGFSGRGRGRGGGRGAGGRQDSGRGKRARANDAKGTDQPAAKKNKFTGTCYNCGETGHMKRDCPKPKKKPDEHQ